MDLRTIGGQVPSQPHYLSSYLYVLGILKLRNQAYERSKETKRQNVLISEDLI
jgi:hypothetical protein